MTKKQSESLSKRQLRKEEIRKKERQQRTILIGGLALISVVILGIMIVPSVQKAANPAGDFVRITPQTYPEENGTSLGNPNAKVRLDLFEDFQCSACAIYTSQYEPDIIKSIVANNDVYYVFHQFPFEDDRSTEKGSDRAALASECAAEQNRFWDYKNLLFANQIGVEGQYSEVRLIAFAESLKLDMDQFQACLTTAKYQAELDAGLQLGTEMNVKGTPSLFVNGQEVSPGRVPTFDEVNQLVQQALQGN